MTSSDPKHIAGLSQEALEWMERGAREYDRFKAEAERDEERARQLDRVLRLHTLPIKTSDAEVIANGSAKRTRCVAAVDAWLASDVPILVLSGGVGRGKTFAAAYAYHQRRDAKYIGAREFERVFSARYGDELEAQDTCMTVSMLVVDDVGRERDAEAMTYALLDLVDDRRKDDRRTILISNLGRQQLKQRYRDERLWSRLGEPDVCMWLIDKGEDMRADG